MYENNVVKSRQVGGSVVVTMPGGEAQIHYSVAKTLGGTYIYTPYGPPECASRLQMNGKTQT